MDTLCSNNGISGISHFIPVTATSTSRANPSRVGASGRSASSDKQRSLFSTFRDPLKSLWPKRTNGLAIDDAVLVEKTDTHENGVISTTKEGEGDEGQNGKWVFNNSHANSLWGNGANDNDNNDDEEKDEKVPTLEYDRESFSRMLRRVSLSEARLYEMMSHLGNLAYSIPIIESGNLLKDYGLHFVTSSTEKKNLDATTEQDQESGEGERKEQKSSGYKISASAAYEIAIAFASNLHAQTRSILPFKSSNDEVVAEGSLEASKESVDCASMTDTEEASWSATSDSVMAVVAAKEEQKQALADDLKSTSSPPCEWYICDDDLSCTRFFVIQGSVSIKAWLANLLLDPIQFEGLDVLVHRGIYEVAKGIYQQMLPEVHAHWKSKGSNATFCFTGHSLGGSLALLVNLMLLIRKEVPVTSLLPVITFGAPSIMCGGDSLLDKVGLPRNHVQAITMHRDVVPRAFSCNCHNQLAGFLKVVNSKIRNHLCLNEQKYIYEPMGELLILQPDENFSPSHHLLPSGSGLYILSATLSESNNTNKQLRVAQLAFLNSPHPFDIILDRSSYGSEGTLIRDHDMKSYLKSVRTVIRQELNQIRWKSREKQRKVWWPLVRPHGSGAGIVVGRSLVSVNVIQDQPPFSRILQTGRVLEKVW